VKPQTEIRQDVAIIGVSGRYPQAGNLEAFWENLKAGRDCITEIPRERWDYSRYFDSEKGKAGKSYSKWGGFLEGVDEFDPLFFNISPREAKTIDPQERLFLQCVYETLEDAGYTRERLSGYKARDLEGNVGVFVGVMYEEYQLFGAQAQALGRPFALPGSASSIANRISYFCNFHGPSLALDTMCSSSLTAIHLACQSLQHGGCELAIAGGVNVSIHPNKYLALSQGQFVSSQGRCESFGEGGDGYVPGEGVGAVLLKPLAQAIADNDRIYGVIKATAINHGGKTNGYSVPSPIAQASVIAQALKESGIPARAVSYLEAHGTGTKLGDPIEIAGLSKAFSEFTQDRQFCAIGSVKSNIGHAESASGIAGLTKILLQMKYGFLAPSLHAESLNPHIEFANSPFRVQRELSEWKRPVVVLDGVTKEYPRIAGISSFGAGGSNAHLILEEYVAVEESRPAAARRSPPELIVLSAKSEEQLLQQTRNLTVALEQGNFSDADLLNIAYTLQVGREAMDHRLALSASSVHEITRKLERFVAGEQGIEDLYRGEAKRNKEALSLLANEKEWEEIVDKWIERGKYAKLLEAWAKGLSFDWTRLYGEGRPRPVRLPTYPFARERYWIDIPELDQAVAGAEKLAAPAQDVSSGSRVTRTGESESNNIVRAETFLRKEWQPSFARTSDPAGLRKKIFILADAETQSLATGLAERFPGSYVLYAGGPELLHAVNAIPFEDYEGWVDLIGCGRGKDATLQWISYLQQWIERGSRRSPVALCVTRGLESYENSGVNLAGASRAGLYRMLQSEYGYLRSRHADLEMETADHILLDQIGAEIVTNTDEPEVCYRSGIRYRASLREFLDAKIEVEERVVLPHDAVLWITGGTRGIGYACARHFIRSYGVRRLVLAGRESFPPREQWGQYQLREDSIGQKIRAIQLLEADGAEIRVSSAPLTNQEALRKELAEVHQVWGPVNGVIHAAGLMDLDNPAFIRKSLDQIATVMAPKVTGLDNLLQCFEEEPLQFVALFSSVSGIIPNLAVGQSDYAMANAYMDYMADSLRHKLPVVSIQWPNWKESGLGETTSRAYRQTGFLSHTDNEGLKLLDRVLAMRRGGVALPAIVNADAWRPERLMSRSQESVPVRTQSKTSSDRKPPTGADVLRQRTHAWLLSTVSESLNIDLAKLEIDTGLQDYGADSVMLAQLLQHVSKLIGEKLDPSILYEYPTVQAFASWLLQRYARQLEEAFAVAEIQTSSQELAPTDFSEGGPQLTPIGVREKRSGASNSETDIAVIGMSCRFPGAGTLEEYWRLLAEGRSAIRPVPRQRWGHASNYYAGLLDNITHFDPAFFLIPENTAAAMDPQAFLLLEEGLKTCYHAGYLLEEIKGSATGVYLGARGQHHPEDTLLYAAKDPIVAVGQNYLAANISRYFDFHGPSLVVDTACSSALVAMNLAIQALLNGEIETALVGGVNILQTDTALRILEHRGILSSSPYFHIFDGRANGSILGEGAGMVLLKRIDKAQKDQDRIYAVVKSVAINNDGRTAGPTAPNLQARKEVLQKALAQSGKDPEKIGYIDVNGSGSEVTDLLELKAIEAIYRPSTKVPCRLGSMKPNIGHPLCAQGIASFLKVALMLHHGRWVPFLSGQEPMRHYDFVSSPFQFTRVLEEWDSPSRSAAINCFADGGTNAHIILESHESSRERDILRRPIQPPTFKRVDVRAFRSIQSQRTSGNHKGEAPAPEYHNEAKDVPDIGAEARFWRRPSKTNGSNGHHTH